MKVYTLFLLLSIMNNLNVKFVWNKQIKQQYLSNNLFKQQSDK